MEHLFVVWDYIADLDTKKQGNVFEFSRFKLEYGINSMENMKQIVRGISMS